MNALGVYPRHQCWRVVQQRRFGRQTAVISDSIGAPPCSWIPTCVGMTQWEGQMRGMARPRVPSQGNDIRGCVTECVNSVKNSMRSCGLASCDQDPAEVESFSRRVGKDAFDFCQAFRIRELWEETGRHGGDAVKLLQGVF